MARWRITTFLSKCQDWVVEALPRGMVLEPWESCIACSGLVNGVALFFIQPRSLEQLLPMTVVLAWGITLLISCFFILYGVIRISILPERVGLQLFASACIAFSIAIVTVLGWYGMVLFVPYMFFSLAAIIRLWLLRKGYRRVAVRSLGGNGAS